jgi:hypothetical protein
VKENILFAPGANSSTVMVVIICRKENSGYSISPQPTESIQPPCHRNSQAIQLFKISPKDPIHGRNVAYSSTEYLICTNC